MRHLHKHTKRQHRQRIAQVNQPVTWQAAGTPRGMDNSPTYTQP